MGPPAYRRVGRVASAPKRSSAADRVNSFVFEARTRLAPAFQENSSRSPVASIAYAPEAPPAERMAAESARWSGAWAEAAGARSATSRHESASGRLTTRLNKGSAAG